METMLYYLREILGEPPAGFESIEYIVAACLVVLLSFAAVAMISGIFRWIGGK